jgi:hypothetical protein
MAKIRIQVGREEFDATLTEETAPETVSKILAALPIASSAKRWGEEIYFEIPVSMGEENAVDTVRKGDLGYWPEGECFCIFFGKTPMTTSEDEIKPASAVNPIGCIENPDALNKHRAGETVTITRESTRA